MSPSLKLQSESDMSLTNEAIGSGRSAPRIEYFSRSSSRLSLDALDSGGSRERSSSYLFSVFTSWIFALS